MNKLGLPGSASAAETTTTFSSDGGGTDTVSEACTTEDIATLLEDDPVRTILRETSIVPM
jgi:hypothetical protein